VPANLVLIGFSGTGKSTVAGELAARLGWLAVDTDADLVARFGMSIGNVFREVGEPAFRAAEREAVVERCEGTKQVISVGGGAPVDPVGRAAILDGNVVVRLDATPETILRRLREGPNAEERPMVAGVDPLGRIQSLLAARSAAYAIADYLVDTENRTPAAVALDVLAFLTSSNRFELLVGEPS
jgi:shikimate kinase